MIRKHMALIAACLLGVTGILTVSFDLSGKPDNGAWVDSPLLTDPGSAAKLNPIEEALLNPKRLPPLPPERIDSETLWLARAIYSESKRPEEQLLVAWVVRNRVETGYRGKKSYRDVILDPFQFSAFIPTNAKRPFYVGLSPQTRAPGWQQALRIAHTVRKLDVIYRPFPDDTRHFFSEQAMTNGGHPAWARGMEPVTLDEPYEVESRRFRFYSGVS